MIIPFISYIKTHISIRTVEDEPGIIQREWLDRLTSLIAKITGDTKNIICRVVREKNKRAETEDDFRPKRRIIATISLEKLRTDDEVLSISLPKEKFQQAYDRNPNFRELFEREIGGIKAFDYVAKSFLIVTRNREATDPKPIREYLTHYKDNPRSKTLDGVRSRKITTYSFSLGRIILTAGTLLGLVASGALYLFQTSTEKSLDTRNDDIKSLSESGELPKRNPVTSIKPPTPVPTIIPVNIHFQKLVSPRSAISPRPAVTPSDPLAKPKDKAIGE